MSRMNNPAHPGEARRQTCGWGCKRSLIYGRPRTTTGTPTPTRSAPRWWPGRRGWTPSAKPSARSRTWPGGILASFTRIAERITEHGPNLGMPYTRAMGDGLFEIRAKGQEGIGRALFCTVVGKRIVILHGFIKKTEQTPRRALDTARRRMKEVRP